MTKIQNFPFFNVFLHFLSHFQRTLWIGMSKTFINVNSCCPVVFYEANCCFLDDKYLKLTPKMMEKTQHFLKFKVFAQFLSIFWQTSWIGMLKSIEKKFVVH